MYAAAEPGSSEPTLTRRAVSIVLTIVIHLLLLLMLLRVAPHFVPVTKPAEGPITVTLDPDQGEQAAAAKQTPAPKTRKAAAADMPKAPPPPPPVEDPPPTPAPPVNILYLSRNDMAASDIGKMPAASAPAAPTSGSSKSGDDDAPLGRGPAGQRLYAAQWYREPTNAELDFYLPKNRAAEGSGLIACQTVARFHVDNCVALGEDPRGSGLASAVLNAAWQFLVRPPRIDGREMVGEWVRIRIDYTNAGPRLRR